MASPAQIIRRRRARKAYQRARQSRNRLWTGFILFIIALVVVLPLGVTLGSAAVVYLSAVKDLPTPQESLSNGLISGTTELYDSSGQTLLLADKSNDQRTWITLDKLPSHVLQATLLAEDPNFLSQTHFDLVGTISHLWDNMLFGPLPEDTTLTGRLVRNVIAPMPEVPSSDDIARQIALVAEIERRYTPQQILEWQLNTDDYGNQAYGIEAAAETYLGKHAVDLSVDEAALLAAIPLAPQYNPFDNETASRGRQLDLLRAMRAAGDITPDQFDLAAATVTPILLASNQPEQIAPEFVAYARRQAQDILDAQGRNGAQLVAHGGLKIVTTLDLDLYYQSECAVQTVLARLNGKAADPNAANGQLCQTANEMPPPNPPLAQGAPDTGSLVLIDAATGEIRSMVGSATVLDEQPGPTLLPFVYFTGFRDSQGYNPAKMVLDIPSRYPGAQEGLIYSPEDADGIYRGPMNLRDAMASWLLTPAVQVASTEGLENVLVYAHRIGLNSLGEDGHFDLSLLERGGAVSLLDTTYAYSVFASLGEMRGVPIQSIGRGYRQRNPVAVLRIEDGDGNVIWNYDTNQVTTNQVAIFPPALGYLVNDILSDDDKRQEILGDTSILDFHRRAAVVNGLTKDLTDDWTVGYTPQLVGGVHLSRSDETAMGLDPLGLQGAALAWRAVMQYAHDRDNLPSADWTQPDGIVQMPVCERSGLLPNDVCPVRNEIFLAQDGYQPTQTDTYWQKVQVNSQTGQRATASTPPELRSDSLFFVPPTEAMDWWKAHNQPLPPTELDTISRPSTLSSVQILQPAALAYVGGTVDVRGTLDPTSMQYYQLAYGQGANPSQWIQIGQQHKTFTQGATLEKWDTTGLSGLYNLLLTVVQNDNTAETATVQVIVDNTPPTITLNAGSSGQTFRWPTDTTVPLETVVDDDYGIDRVEFYHNGEFLGADNDAPYGFNWTITRTGTETFTAVVFDKVGNQATSQVTVQIVRG